MNEKEYISERLDDQIKWYDNKSRLNKRWFYGLRFAEIGFSAAITFCAGIIAENSCTFKVVIGMLGSLVVVISAILGVSKSQENWIQYRSTAESLKHEKYLYLTKVEPYNGENAFSLLVQRIESLISKENSSWTQYIVEKEPAKHS